MDNRGGAMQRRMDSHGMPAHPPLHSSAGKYEVAVTHSSHSLYDDRMPTKNNNSKEMERERSQVTVRWPKAGQHLT